MGRPTFSPGKNGPAHSFPGEKLTGGKFRPVTGKFHRKIPGVKFSGQPRFKIGNPCAIL